MKAHAVNVPAVNVPALAHAWKGLAVPRAPVLADSPPAFEPVSGAQAPAEANIS